MAIAVDTDGTLHVEAGASGVVSFKYRVPVPGSDPVTYVDASLPGWEARFQVRKSASASGDPVVNKVLSFDGTTAVLSLTAAEASALVSGVYGIELKHPSGEPVVRLAQGKLKVSPEVVR